MVDLLIFTLSYSRKNVLGMRLTQWNRCEIWGVKEKEKKNHPYKDGNKHAPLLPKCTLHPNQVWSGDRQRKHSEKKKKKEEQNISFFERKTPKCIF